jgi:gliding motility-associated protein GldL
MGIFSFFNSKAGKKVIAFFYGVGASIVILGALFKILHLPGANLMLMAGMGTEAFIFLISAFEPLPAEYHWDLVFPELEGGEAHSAASVHSVQQQQQRQPNFNLDFSVDQSTTDGLKRGIQKFSQSIEHMSNLSSLVDATAELTGKLHSASGSVTAVSESAGVLADTYYKNAQSLQQYNEQSQLNLNQMHSGYEFYRGQLDTLGRTLGALNSSYELYLQESKRLQGDYSAFHGDMVQLLGNIHTSISETQKLGTQMSSLNNNVENLNSIYGSMLTAVNSVLNR